MPTTFDNTNTVTQFTIDFSNCNCSQLDGGSEPGGSEPFEVKFEQNKKGILVRIKNKTSNILDLVIVAYLVSIQKYFAKSVSMQANSEALAFFPVHGVEDVIFSIYEKTDDCTLVFDEQTKTIIFSSENVSNGALCILSGNEISSKVFIKRRIPEDQTPVVMNLDKIDSVFDIGCFCVKIHQ